MEPEILFDSLKDANTQEYKRRLTLDRVKKAICTFFIFPLTFTLFAAGGLYSAQDALVIRTEDEPYAPQGKSLTARKNGKNASEDRIEYETITEEEIAKTEETAFETAESPDKNEELLLYLYDFDYSKVPSGKYGIIPTSLYKPITEDTLPVKNSSSLKIDWRDYKDMPLDLSVSDEGPQILIIHTHGTEAYVDEGVFYCGKNEYMRSEDKSKSVIGIGDVFERTFLEAGINTLHCEIPIDKESYSKAYSNAAKIIKGYLKEYPTIKYVFDIHRDSVDYESGEKGRLVTAVDGKAAAQVMFVVGTDENVSANKNWGGNFALAIKLQYALDEKYDSFVRPINIKSGAYNQYFTPFSLLIEIGSDGNTFAEAEYSAELVAEQIVHILKGDKK